MENSSQLCMAPRRMHPPASPESPLEGRGCGWGLPLRPRLAARIASWPRRRGGSPRAAEARAALPDPSAATGSGHWPAAGKGALSTVARDRVLAGGEQTSQAEARPPMQQGQQGPGMAEEWHSRGISLGMGGAHSEAQMWPHSPQAPARCGPRSHLIPRPPAAQALISALQPGMRKCRGPAPGCAVGQRHSWSNAGTSPPFLSHLPSPAL